MALNKYYKISIVISLFIMAISCDENSVSNSISQQTKSMTANTRVTNYTFDGTEGNPISLDTAIHWIANYKNANAKLSSHFFGRKTIEKILAKNNCIGLRFYYSLDNSAVPNLLVRGANSKGNDLMFPFEARGRNSSIEIDAKSSSINDTYKSNDADSVSADISKKWISNYYEHNPTAIRAHFFGYEIINQILSEKGCVGIRAYYALNGSGVQQLLLVGVNSNGENLLPLTNSTNDRVADDDENVIADMSVQCPYFCPEPGT